MNAIPLKTTWLAVHRILAAEQIGVGQRLPLRHLMSAWSTTGLRQRDLGVALESLLRTGSVHLEAGDAVSGPTLLLLDEGFGLLAERGRDGHAVRLLDDLRSARARPAHLAFATPAGTGRRADDRLAA